MAAVKCTCTDKVESVEVPKAEHEQGSEAAINEAFMTAACMSAIAGVRIGHGGPFGASIVRDGVIVSCAHNMVLFRGDPCAHAEMNAISQACRALGTHDLSDCDLYTTCEPCPMCWGAVQWSRVSKAHIGADRYTAAKYGFDDKVFYDEIDNQGKASYGIRATGCMSQSGAIEQTPDEKASNGDAPDGGQRKRRMSVTELQRVDQGMVQVFDGVLQKECEELFMDPKVNRTLKRRFKNPAGQKLMEAHKEVFSAPNRVMSPPDAGADGAKMREHERFMKHAVEIARWGAKAGLNKEREPFAAVIVKDGSIISEGCNTVMKDNDCIATAEINAIRGATQRLETHNLSGCSIYVTAHPDLMSLGAILWARIENVYCGVTQQFAASCGFEEGIIHFKDLMEDIETEHKITEVVLDVAKEACERVFQEWSDRNGVIY